ncbi:VOC family protein [Sphingomonas lenta]|uniref:Glyoxalase n=1 Tax=Sphingomonas lenta TaxID=1141887 RepID=A0A2A2SCM5_9SPHN|nr:VOC family protein [Sphingomonas lenta]PAX07016.1 glyoxalase [Sphingomonas lenta]
MNSTPPIDGLLETAIYVDDMDRAVRFYEEVLGLPAMLRTPRLTAFDAGRSGVLLVFARGMTEADSPTPGGVVPGHDGAGRLHFAFAITADSYDAWRAHLLAKGVAIRSEVAWPKGSRSLYFNDPDGHVVELATPGLWPNY